MPNTQKDACNRWICQCNRPFGDLNETTINRNYCVCSKHFLGGKGPTQRYPDPLHADGRRPRPIRSPPTFRSPLPKSTKGITRSPFTTIQRNSFSVEDVEQQILEQVQTLGGDKENEYPEIGTQTEEQWISPLDLLSQAVELEQLKSEIRLKNVNFDDLTNQLRARVVRINTLANEIRFKDVQINDLTNQLTAKDVRIGTLEHEMTNIQQRLSNRDSSTSRTNISTYMTVGNVLAAERRIPGLFKYYTAITFVRFQALFQFICPEGKSVDYPANRVDVLRMEYIDCLLLYMCRLRHNFGLRDIAFRLCITTQAASDIFNTWLELMYLKLGLIPLWPHRDIIIANMPTKFKEDFPTTMCIIDGTEIRTQVPSAMANQSMMYSDYKSGVTLKALVACDPSGSLLFCSELFTGSISDKAISNESVFFYLLKKLVDIGHLQNGDAVMSDKGFTVNEQLAKLGIQLNIPPKAQSGFQFTAAQTELTTKVAKHRVHIERFVHKVKTYKMLSDTIPCSMFSKVNQIWTVGCLLTLFQDTFVVDSEAS